MDVASGGWNCKDHGFFSIEAKKDDMNNIEVEDTIKPESTQPDKSPPPTPAPERKPEPVTVPALPGAGVTGVFFSMTKRRNPSGFHVYQPVAILVENGVVIDTKNIGPEDILSSAFGNLMDALERAVV